MIFPGFTLIDPTMHKDIEKVIQRLDILIGKGSAHCYFNGPASDQEISSFEERNNICLPASFKRFLKYANGGMIISERLNSLLDTTPNREDIIWNANYIYSLDRMETAYKEMSSWDFGLPYQSYVSYPFIPFLHTESGEHLIFITLEEGQTESAVLDAYHEETPETWGVVADSFATFLDAYIDAAGYPNLLGELANGNALELVDPLLNPPMNKEETAEEVIKRTTAILKKHPDRHWQRVLRGLAFRDQGKMENALRDINRAIEENPGDAFYHYSRGDVLENAGKIRPALIDYDVAVKMAPSDPLYLSSRAGMLFKMNKFEDALKDASEAIRINDSFVLAYMIREEIYRNMGETDKANADAGKIEELGFDQ